MQQPGQPKQGLIGSTLQRLENAARSAAPGLGQQVDKLLTSVGVSTTMQPGPSYQQQIAISPYSGVYQQPSSWPYVQPGAGHPLTNQQQKQLGPHNVWLPPAQPPAGHPQQLAYQPRPVPITQVYPPPAAAHPAYPAVRPLDTPMLQPAWQQPQVQPAWQQPQVQPQMRAVEVHYAQPGHHQQQQPQPQPQPQAQVRYAQPRNQQQRREIPIIEATVDIKPSGLPVGGTPATGKPATPAPESTVVLGTPAVAGPAQHQPQQDIYKQLWPVWARAVPASSQAAAAAEVTGSWYHQDAGWLSELTFMSDGRFYWSKTSSSSGGAQTNTSGAYPPHSPAAAVAAAGAPTACCSSPGSQVEIWHGIWQLQEDNATTGKLQLVYFTQQQLEQHQKQPGTAAASSQRQHDLAYQRSALDDTLVLDQMAHVKLGPA